MMKPYTLIWILILFSSLVYGQGRSLADHKGLLEKKQTTLSYDPGTSSRAFEERVFYPTRDQPCEEFVTVLSLAPFEIWGVVSGTNGFGDLEKAQRLNFTASTDFKVIGAFMYSYAVGIVNDGLISVKIYDVDDRGGPGSLLGESIPIHISEAAVPDTMTRETVFVLHDSLDVKPFGSEFFVSLDISRLYESADTFAVFQTNFDCGSGDDTWDRWSDGSWIAINDTFAWHVDADYLLGAIVEFDEYTNVHDFIADGILQLNPPSPNPARNEISLNYTLEAGSDVNISLYDVRGRQLFDRNVGYRGVGKHGEFINTSNLSPGQYFYRISTKQGHLASRFIKQ